MMTSRPAGAPHSDQMSTTGKHGVHHARARVPIIIIVIIYSLKIGAGQQGRIPGTYNCPQYKIKCRNIKYRKLQKTRPQSQHSNSANTSLIVIAE